MREREGGEGGERGEIGRKKEDLGRVGERGEIGRKGRGRGESVREREREGGTFTTYIHTPLSIAYSDQYHIWHKGSCDKTADAKKESAEFGGLWWLRGDWRELTALYPDKMGYEWLQLITNYTNY